MEPCVCVAVDLWEPHQQSLLQWDASTFCVRISIASDFWKEACHSNDLSSIALSQRCHRVSAFIHSLKPDRIRCQVSGSMECSQAPLTLKFLPNLGLFWPNLAAFEAHVRRELFSFQCEKRQISRSESTFSFQRRHMHAPQSGVNGLCEECLEDVNRERRSSAVCCGLFVYSV